MHSKKTVLMRNGDHRVRGDLEVAVRTVLESDRHRQPTRQFAMGLALGCTGPDRGPTDQRKAITAVHGPIWCWICERTPDLTGGLPFLNLFTPAFHNKKK